MSVDGREVVLDQGGAAPPTDEAPAKPEKRKGGRGMSTSSGTPKSAPVRSGVGVVTATLIPSDSHVTVPLVAKETGEWHCCRYNIDLYQGCIVIVLLNLHMIVVCGTNIET